MVQTTIQPAAEKGTALPAKKIHPRTNQRKNFAALLGGMPGKGAASREASAAGAGGTALKAGARKSVPAGKPDKDDGAQKNAAQAKPGRREKPEDGRDFAGNGGIPLFAPAAGGSVPAAKSPGAGKSAGGAAVPAAAAGAAASAVRTPGPGKIAFSGDGRIPDDGGPEGRRAAGTSRHAKRMADAKERARSPEEKRDVRREEPEKVDKAPQSPEEAKKEPAREAFEIRVSSRNAAERAQDSPRAGTPSDVRGAGSEIFNRLREEGNERIVRSARVVLRNRDSGEIRLILKPERLGEVRIRLSLKDNLIGGRILVENENVRDAFERNLPELAAAFRDSGFDVGNLDVSVGGGAGRENAGADVFPRFDGPRGAAELERGVPSADAAGYYAAHAVNFMA